jgi:hypothetical protein
MAKPPNFVMLPHHVLDTPAWRAMSHGARSLYVTLKRRWNHNRLNLVYVSERVAAEELGSPRDQIRRWFRELQYYGFIVMEQPGYLGSDGKGKAPHYRLTECNTHAPKGSEISRLLTFQNTIDVASRAPKNIDDVATSIRSGPAWQIAKIAKPTVETSG